jgi:hypothetical protein
MSPNESNKNNTDVVAHRNNQAIRIAYYGRANIRTEGGEIKGVLTDYTLAY